MSGHAHGAANGAREESVVWRTEAKCPFPNIFKNVMQTSDERKYELDKNKEESKKNNARSKDLERILIPDRDTRAWYISEWQTRALLGYVYMLWAQLVDTHIYSVWEVKWQYYYVEDAHSNEQDYDVAIKYYNTVIKECAVQFGKHVSIDPLYRALIDDIAHGGFSESSDSSVVTAEKFVRRSEKPSVPRTVHGAQSSERKSFESKRWRVWRAECKQYVIDYLVCQTNEKLYQKNEKKLYQKNEKKPW
jgi:hypothetical protein